MLLRGGKYSVNIPAIFLTLFLINQLFTPKFPHAGISAFTYADRWNESRKKMVREQVVYKILLPHLYNAPGAAIIQ